MFKLDEKVRIIDTDNYNNYVQYYDVPVLKDNYLKNTIFTISGIEMLEKNDRDNEELYQYELVDMNNYTLPLWLDGHALEKI